MPMTGAIMLRNMAPQMEVKSEEAFSQLSEGDFSVQRPHIKSGCDLRSYVEKFTINIC